MSDLKIERLHKHYGSFHVVKGVDLAIPSGEFTVLVGPSGCGKSTLLRCIAGLEEVSEGRVMIGGQDVTHARPRDRDIAMVFQNYALYPFLTVQDNIAFGLRARKFAEVEIQKRVKRAADMLDIGALLARYPRELSGGQRQRVAIGRAVVRDAQLFLFDEPLSNLDAQLRDDMRTEIKRLHQELKRTMIYVTHDQIEAMTLADRIVLLREGKIEQVGSPLDLFERPASQYVASFLGSPRMNFVAATVEGNYAVLSGGARINIGSRALATGRNITLGIRPQHVSLSQGTFSVPVRIELVQPTGTRLHATMPLGGTTFVAEFDAHAAVAPGSNVLIYVDPQRIIMIDPDTQSVI